MNERMVKYVVCVSILASSAFASSSIGAQSLRDLLRRGQEIVQDAAEDVKDAVDRVGDNDDAPPPNQPSTAPAATLGSPSTPTSATVAAGAPWDYPPISQVSRPMLAYKLNPGLFSEDILVSSAARQIQWDQQYYARETPPSQMQQAYPPLFQENEVRERNPEFAAREMLPAYRSRLSEIAGRMPTRYTGIIGIGRPGYDHGSGVLHGWNSPNFLLNESASMDVRGFEGRAVYRFDVTSQLQATTDSALQALFGVEYQPYNDQNPHGAPVSLASNVPLPASRGAYVVLDRRIEIPALAMSAAEAERLLTPPNVPVGVTADMEARRDATGERAKFLDALLFIVDLEFDRLTVDDSQYLFEANLLGAKLLGTRGELMATYSPSDFPSASELFEQQRAAQTAVEAEAQQRAAAAEREELASLQALDILGIRLGSRLSDTQSTLASSFAISGVYRFSAPEMNSVIRATSGNRGFDFHPYSQGLIFVGQEGKDFVTVYEVDGVVVGIARKMSAAGLSAEAVGPALLEKYGEPASGSSSRWMWGDNGPFQHCTGQGNPLLNRSPVELVQGAPLAQAPPWAQVEGVGHAATAIAVSHGNSETLASCKPVLIVNGVFSGPAAYVDFRLFDHSRMAAALKAAEDGAANRQRDTASGLAL